MGVTVKTNPAGLKQLYKEQSLGLRLAGDLVVAKITKEVPIDTGILRRSAFANGKRVPNSKDKELEIYISWNTEYAAKLYYGTDIVFREPGAKAYWGLSLMNNSKEMQSIIQKSINAVSK